jgi:hypothetical protein
VPAVVAGAALALAGCVTTTTKSIPTTPMADADLNVSAGTSGGNGNAQANTAAVDSFTGGDRRTSADEAVAANPSDVSAGRLHDIEGMLLMYCALHKRMPARLEDLRPLADADTDLQLTAPSGQPYLYVPYGLVAKGATLRIVVADPAPSAKGSRWCILVPPVPISSNAPASMEVVAVPEVAFRQYVPAE